jgi:hypothetical protein
MIEEAMKRKGVGGSDRCHPRIIARVLMSAMAFLLIANDKCGLVSSTWYL